MAKSRRATITVEYHYTTAGRRYGLRKDVSQSALKAIVRRLQRHGALVVDKVEIKES